MTEWKSFNPKVIAEFRASGGKVARFGDLPLVILHTLGAKSGTLREVPLIVVLDQGDLLLFGTNEGARRDPIWCVNLRAHPKIDVEYGAERFAANVVELPAEQAAEKLAKKAETSAQLVDYLQKAAPRRVPVFRIERGLAAVQ